MWQRDRAGVIGRFFGLGNAQLWRLDALSSEILDVQAQNPALKGSTWRIDSSKLLPDESRCLTRFATGAQVAMEGSSMGKKVSRRTRDELITALCARDEQGGREAKARILDEFGRITGYHRKHA
ncbi:MAG: hypothetical protein RL701_1555, partial [Pseudomonadota bacterium]